jgi:hypothetical protein
MASDVGGTPTPDPAVPSNGWWKTYLELIPEGYLDLIAAEEDASRLVHFHSTFIPGLLQTERYATAICPATSLKALTDAEVSTLVRVRMLRQRSTMHASPAKTFVFLLDETSLRRPVGPPEIMREQLEHLLDIAEHPLVTLIVVPFRARPHAGHLGPFMLLQYGEGLDDVLCFEWQLGNMVIRDQPDVTARYRTLAAGLIGLDTEGAQSKRLIAAALAEVK